MARSVRCLMNLNLGFFSKSLTRPVIINQTRTLFSPSSLGMIAYLSQRNNYKNQFLNLEDSFRGKMQSYVENDVDGMIFTEDLKVMLHLVEKTPEDVDLIVKMLRKFTGQSGDLRFGTYIFGPIVMRAFHRINEPRMALDLFNDPQFRSFFNQLTTYQILLDLLYCNKMYMEMTEVYSTIKDRLTDGRVHPRNALILVTAGCYKENSPESYKYAMQLWRELDRRGYPTIRRVLTHMGALALNQRQPHIALEMLQTAKKPRYIGIRCLKIMAFADIDRVDDIVPFFRSSLEADDPNVRKETYFKDTIEKVEAAIQRNKVSPDAEIVKLLKLIKSSDMIQPETIEAHIDGEIHVVPQYHLREKTDYRSDNRNYENPDNRNYGNSDNRNYGNSDNRNYGNSDNRTKFVRRPGLRDIV